MCGISSYQFDDINFYFEYGLCLVLSYNNIDTSCLATYLVGCSCLKIFIHWLIMLGVLCPLGNFFKNRA